MAYMVYTYGGGESLELLFNGIVAILGHRGQGDFFNIFVTLGFMAGLLMTLVSSFKGDLMTKVAGWFLPLYIALTLLFIPSTSLWIKDMASGHVAKVDHVPWGLAAFAGTISPLSHHLTERIESIFSLPDDLKYHKTGAMMASTLLAHAKTFHITNLDLAETVKDFFHQCIAYDALRGVRFTLDDLKRATDLWTFMKENASSARSFTYRDPLLHGKSEIVSCKVGAGKLDVLIKRDIEGSFSYFAKKMGLKGRSDLASSAIGNHLKGHLVASFGFMAGLQQFAEDAETLMRQNMMIHTVIDAVDSKATAMGQAPDFSVRRAYLQQRTSQETMAGVAEKTMLALKNVMEAIAYAAFIFVLPLVMLPRGWRFLSNWAFLVAWIHMWPPLYAIVNFIMSVTAQQKGIQILSACGGITLANAVGFADLHADMAAQAGYMSLSVGVLAYALVKGGTSSFMSLAGNMMSPTSTAVSKAVEDQMTGNYSFGNLGLGTVQAYNHTFLQHMHSPSHHSGAFSEHDGQISRVSTLDGSSYVTVATSHLRSNISWGEAVSTTLSEQASSAMTAAHTQSQAASRTQADVFRQAMDLASHQATLQSYGDSRSVSQNKSQGQSYTELNQLMNQFSAENRVDSSATKQFLAKAAAGLSVSAKFPGVPLSATLNADMGGNYTGTSTDTDIDSKARQFVEQASFQKVLNDTVQYAKDKRFHYNDEQSTRLSDSIAQSSEKADHYRQEAQASLQKATSYTDMAQFARQHNTALQANLNQEFVAWLSQQPASGTVQAPMGKRAAETLVAGDAVHVLPYQKRFLEDYAHRLHATFKNHEAGTPLKVQDAYDPTQVAPLPHEHRNQFKKAVQEHPLASHLGDRFKDTFSRTEDSFHTTFEKGFDALGRPLDQGRMELSLTSLKAKHDNKATGRGAGLVRYQNTDVIRTYLPETLSSDTFDERRNFERSKGGQPENKHPPLSDNLPKKEHAASSMYSVNFPSTYNQLMRQEESSVDSQRTESLIRPLSEGVQTATMENAASIFQSSTLPQAAKEEIRSVIAQEFEDMKEQKDIDKVDTKKLGLK